MSGIRVLCGRWVQVSTRRREAVLKWGFEPGLKEGKPVPVVVQIEVNSGCSMTPFRPALPFGLEALWPRVAASAPVRA